MRNRKLCVLSRMLWQGGIREGQQAIGVPAPHALSCPPADGNPDYALCLQLADGLNNDVSVFLSQVLASITQTQVREVERVQVASDRRSHAEASVWRSRSVCCLCCAWWPAHQARRESRQAGSLTPTPWRRSWTPR